MRIVTIDIIDPAALQLLGDLEKLQLIRILNVEKGSNIQSRELITKYRGAMKKQSVQDIDTQLNNLRNGRAKGENSLAERFAGTISAETADALQKQITQSREE